VQGDAGVDWKQYIEQNPDVMLGKPVIKGTRITVEIIMEKLGQGAPEEEILASYPFLRREHIQAAHAYAAAYLSFDRTIFSPRPST
jgi:uncharacterized protein (DUF433 family)